MSGKHGEDIGDDGEEERVCGKEEIDVWESGWKEREDWGKSGKSHRISWNTMEGHGITLGFLERKTLEGSGKTHVGKWKLIEAHRTSWKVLEYSAQPL